MLILLRIIQFTISILLFIYSNKYYVETSKVFENLDYKQLNDRLNQLQSPFSLVTDASYFAVNPTFVSESETCTPKIIRLSHLNSLQSDISRPTIVFTGEIHGDERLGPLVILTLAEILTWSSICEILNNLQACETLEKEYNILHEERVWLANLVSRSDIILIPTANCLGYLRNQRLDGVIDPNRDFPYVRKDNKCLQSNTAKIINNIMLNTLTQIFVTFHGGMVSLAYEWGSLNHMKPKDASPDEYSNVDIAMQLQEVTGSYGKYKKYPIGRMNSIVYPVEGGMEDWLYASGWDRENTRVDCLFMNSEIATNNRALVFLVEVADDKHLPNSELGNSFNILSNDELHDGHVNRNTRLSISAINLLKPYICITQIQSDTSNKNLKLQWTIQGAVTVNDIVLSWHQPSTHSFNHEDWHHYLHNLIEPSSENFNRRRRLRFEKASKILGLATYHYHRCITDNTISESSCIRNSSMNRTGSTMFQNVTRYQYEAEVTSSSFYPHPTIVESNQLGPGQYWLIIWTKVDQKWGDSSQGEPKDINPQSYYVNARTNTSWHTHISTNITSKRVVHGRIWFPSDPILIEINNQGEVLIKEAILHCAWWKPISSLNSFIDEVKSSSRSLHDIHVPGVPKPKPKPKQSQSLPAMIIHQFNTISEQSHMYLILYFIIMILVFSYIIYSWILHSLRYDLITTNDRNK